MSKTIITKTIEKDVVDTPSLAIPKSKKFTFNSEEEIDKWVKEKKIIKDYPAMKKELDAFKKIEKDKVESKKNVGKSIKIKTDGDSVEIYTFIFLFIGIMIYIFLHVKPIQTEELYPDLSLNALRNR